MGAFSWIAQITVDLKRVAKFQQFHETVEWSIDRWLDAVTAQPLMYRKAFTKLLKSQEALNLARLWRKRVRYIMGLPILLAAQFVGNSCRPSKL